jgi:hypothetical protein
MTTGDSIANKWSLGNSLIHKNAHNTRKGLGGKFIVLKSYQGLSEVLNIFLMSEIFLV